MPEAAAIADSGPLIFLTRMNELELLPRLVSKIFVTPEVWREVTARGQGLAGAYEISQARWITIQTPDSHLVRTDKKNKAIS